MRPARSWLLGLWLIVVPTWAAESPGRIVHDIWNTAHFEGGRAGSVHTVIREIEIDGQKMLRTTTELKLSIQRNRNTIQLRMESSTDETTDGKVTGVSMRMFQGEQPQIILKGTVKNDHLAVTVNGKTQLERKIPWNDRVIGLAKQERLFQERKVKPGDKLSFLSFEPTVNNVVTNRVTVKDYEAVEVLGVKKRLLRVETVPDKLEVEGNSIQLPTLITWLDKDLLPARSEFEIPLLGTIVLYRSTREGATRPPTGPAPEILTTSLIPIDKVIDRPNDTKSAVYRIKVKGEKDPQTAFVQDGRQACKNVKDDTFELHIRAQPKAGPVGDAGEVKEEYLKTCQWIDSDDATVKAQARRAVGPETDPWEKAKRIEKWVHHNMRVSFAEEFAPASKVATSLRGDCRQHSLLTTALCRAAGVPARTALGLCYAYDQQRGPVMAFHMWTEVWIKGQWLPIDATRGQGYVGATHLKIADHSWYNTPSLTPLLPVYRVLGKLSIEVLRVEEKD
jgi:transglutaminase-like putative cysteine protease